MGRPSAPPEVRWIASELEKAGYETWAVGGAVRDALLGRPSGDWDLATRAQPREMRRIFRRTVPLGIEHGTVGVLRDGTMYEVTTFRRDVETDGRHAVIAFADSIEEDLARRDFTVNAIAWHPLREELFDPFGGVDDLEAGTLRTVGAPGERFREDYLRILRGLRFAGLFELEIEEDTWRSLCGLVDKLTVLSAERIRDELMKVLELDPAPARALDLYARSGALRVLYPELEATRTRTGSLRNAAGVRRGASVSVWKLAVASAQALPKGRPMLRLAGLLRGLPAADVGALLIRLRFSNAAADEAARRATLEPLPPPGASDVEFRRWLSRSGPGRLAVAARLDLARCHAEVGSGRGESSKRESGGCREDTVSAWRRAKRIRAEGPPLEVGDLAVDGRTLIRLGLKPGPNFGRILDGLLEWVLEDPDRNVAERLQGRALQLSRGERLGG